MTDSPDEATVIQSGGASPCTVQSLVGDLRSLGVAPGGTLLVHTSLSSLGWVCGGAQAVILALQETLGPAGTLAMPAHSGQLSDPAGWGNPPVPSTWWDTLRRELPPFDLALTPTRMMGAVAELFRHQAGTLRSGHPTLSFCARGPHAERITSGHQRAFALGDGSPLARLYELDAQVLLLGVGHVHNTSLHLAEHRAQWTGREELSALLPVERDGRCAWEATRDIALRDDLFPAMGAAFDGESGPSHIDKVGGADARVFPQRALVDFAVGWLEAGRGL